MVFSASQSFPEKYRNGAFIAFHGSFDRAPLPQQGFNIVFQPFRDGLPTNSWEVFAEGFGGRRPAGVAFERDGSLIVTDDRREGFTGFLRWNRKCDTLLGNYRAAGISFA
jgi:glucose/arabinose dehydrogenase